MEKKQYRRIYTLVGLVEVFINKMFLIGTSYVNCMCKNNGSFERLKWYRKEMQREPRILY